MSYLNAFLDFLTGLDIFGFVARAKDPTFPIWKLLLVTTIIGLVAIYIYYTWTSKNEHFQGNDDNNVQLLANNVLRIFYTNWCGFCQKSKGDFTRLVEDYNGKTVNGVPVSVIMVDADKNPELTKEFNVNGFPSIILQLANGQRVEYNGDRSYNDLVSFLQNSIPNTQIVN